MATLSDLLTLLANFDPDCPVKVLSASTAWEYGDPLECSIPVTTADWVDIDEEGIQQEDDGTILIGFDWRM